MRIVNIETFQNNDKNFLTSLQPEDWQSILPSFDFYIKSAFCFPIKVVLEDIIVGIGATIIHNDVAWLAHIIVHQDYRNKGIGQEITRHSINTAQTAKCKTIYLIATDLGYPVYNKIGFETETEYLFFKDVIINEATLKNITPFNNGFKEQVINIDREVSGENRVIHIDEHFSNAYVYQIKNKVEGYYLPTFGDGLIIAKTASAGIQLMKLRFEENKTAAIPIGNCTAVDFLHKNNFCEFKKANRMRLGIKRNWQPTNIYNRISGSLG